MEDEEIIRLFQNREETAISEVKKKYHALIGGLIYRIVQNKEDAEECENDAYLGLWNCIPPENPQNLKCFLLRIARNQALKRYRRENAAKRDRKALIPLDELLELADERAADEYSDEELSQLINGFLSSLSPQKRRVFLLRYWCMESISDIMKECGFGKSKVETMLFRMRKELRVYLTERGYRYE